MRVQKDGDDGLLKYTYDDDSVLVQSNNSGQTVAKYDYGPDQLLSLTHSTEGRQFYLFDALGSAVNLTTPGETLQARYQYDAWGNFRRQAGSSFNPFGFTGHERDDETGLYYFKARFYDPDTGRFLSQDPFLGDFNTPPSLHRYLYAYGNPLFYIDLLGYQAEPPIEEESELEKAKRAADGKARVFDSRDQVPPGVKVTERNGRFFEDIGADSFLVSQIQQQEQKELDRNQAEGQVEESHSEPGTRRSVEEVCQGNETCMLKENKRRSREDNVRKLKERGIEAGKKITEEAPSAMLGPVGRIPFVKKFAKKISEKIFKRKKPDAGDVTKGVPSSKVAPASAKQLQKKFMHASDFGVEGNFSAANAKKFDKAIQKHLNAPGTKEIQGTFRGKSVTFHTDPNSGLTVIQNPNGSFLSGWKFSPKQLQRVLKDGKL